MMWQTNLKILFTVLATLAVFTLVANIIPQVQSAVPEEVRLTADMSPEELAAIGEEIYNGVGGCTACHGLGTRAPDLLGVAGTRCGTRQPELSCKEYLYESLVNPTAYVVEGFQPIMLDQSRTLSGAELWALVAFLESQGGTIDVTPDDFAASLAEAPPPPGVAEPPTTADGGIDVAALATSKGCLACHSLGGEGAAVAPPFESLRGKDPEYILRGIVNPNADTAAGYEAFAGVMPPNFTDLLSAEEIDAFVDFLSGAGPAPADTAGTSAGGASGSA